MVNSFDVIERCQREGTPILDADKALFIWHGDEPVRVMGDFNDWEAGEPADMTRLEDDLWIFELALPSKAYMEYIFLNQDNERILDPFNRRITPNGMGKLNQYFYMPKGKPTSLRLRRWGTPEGTVTHAAIPTRQFLVGSKRTVHFYQPPVNDPCPLLVVWDGGDYLRRASLNRIVDNLISLKRIKPVALAMIENGGAARSIEYTCSDTTLFFLMECLLPEAQNRLNLLDPADLPGCYGVLGASMGGLMALYTGLRLSSVFGRVLAQSGAYQLDDFEFITGLMVDHGPVMPLKIWMDVGMFEGLLPCNRQMARQLNGRGYDVQFHEYPAGHNYPAWRDDLPGGLEFLFPIET